MQGSKLGTEDFQGLQRDFQWLHVTLLGLLPAVVPAEQSTANDEGCHADLPQLVGSISGHRNMCILEDSTTTWQLALV